jgi:hypothetical protein
MKNKTKVKDPKIFLCECNSYNHLAIFWLDDEYKQLYVTIHLTTHNSFFKRLWIGLKYAFGFKSKNGEWDSFLFSFKNEQELREYLDDK